MAIVLLLGFAVMMITVVMVVRGSRQTDLVGFDLHWEQALHVAEAGLDDALVQIDTGDSFTTGEAGPGGFAAIEEERAWAIAAADARPPEDVAATPEGEYVIVVPDSGDVAYVVGFVPARSDPTRRTRVVRAGLYEYPVPGPWTARFAFVTGGELTISGNETLFGGSAYVHANGFLTMPGNPTFQDGACLGGSGGADITGNLNVHGTCPTEHEIGSQDEVSIPDIVPRDLWYMSEYDMCPDGSVRAGPAHPTLSESAGEDPCLGMPLEADAGSNPFLGWEFTGCCDATLGATWEYDVNPANDGFFYFYQGSATVSSGPGVNNDPWYVSIVAESIVAVSGEPCSELVGGDITLNGSMVMAPYTQGSIHADSTVTAVAGRDLVWAGSGRLKAPGLIAALEQIWIDGSLQAEGGFVAGGECDSPDDNLDAPSLISGNPTFRLDGPMETPIISEDGDLRTGVELWDEL